MPVFNAGKFISDAIESILKQSFQDWELLVCNDGSTDNTHQVALSFNDSRIRVFKNSRNIGKANTCNEHLKYCQGEYISIHDADDISHPDRFQTQIDLIESENAGFCGCNMRYMSISGKMLEQRITKRRLPKESFPRYGDATIVIRKELLDQVPLFRTFFKNNMDYDLGLRLMDISSHALVDAYLYYYRNVSNSISKTYDQPEDVINSDIVKDLARMRHKGQKDFLEQGDLEAMESIKKNYLAEFENDKTAHLRKSASFLISIGMNTQALLLALKAIRIDPLNSLTYRTLTYAIRSFFK